MAILRATSDTYAGEGRDRRRLLRRARRDVAIDLPISPEKDDAMSGRVSFVPFDLAVWNENPFTELAVRTTKWGILAIVGDDGHIATIINLEAVGPICVGFATTQQRLDVGLHELLKPLAHLRGLSLPLSKVACCRRGR